MSDSSYITDPVDAEVPRFVELGGVWITHHPLEDTRTGFAHLTYAGALAVAAATGARLPTRDEVLALHVAAAALGTELAPVILPDAALRAQGCVPGDARMITWAWCARHDGLVLARMLQLVNAGTDPAAPIANAGKHWIGPAPQGRAALCGWWMNGELIQSGLGAPHDDQHHDYATTTMLIREVAP